MKAFLLLSITLLGLSFASCKSPSTDKIPDAAVGGRPAAIDSPLGKDIFPVIGLPTDDASAKDPDDKDVDSFKYPARTTLVVPGNLKNRLNVYGASYRLWLAPVVWTGNGNIFTNGGMCVHLYPIGDEALSGAFIHYSEERGNQTTIIQDAAPFFSRCHGRI